MSTCLAGLQWKVGFAYVLFPSRCLPSVCVSVCLTARVSVCVCVCDFWLGFMHVLRGYVWVFTGTLVFTTQLLSLQGEGVAIRQPSRKKSVTVLEPKYGGTYVPPVTLIPLIVLVLSVFC